jgi:hypothetical protein
MSHLFDSSLKVIFVIFGSRLFGLGCNIIIKLVFKWGTIEKDPAHVKPIELFGPMDY